MKFKNILWRYIAIIGRLSNGKKATYEQLKSHLTMEQEIRDRSVALSFSKRTFQREIRDIEEVFNIKIHCSRDGYYSIEEDYIREEVLRFTQGIHFLNYQKHFENFEKHIFYDQTTSKGSHFIFDIQNAIKNCNCLLIKHRKFEPQEDSKNRIVAPYGLKEYLGRWYLVGKDLDIQSYRVFGLDRIEAIELLGRKFEMPSKFSISDYFKNLIGVQKPKEDIVEIVELEIDTLMGNYFKSLPLHSSQKIIQEDKNQITIRLKVSLNNELANEILRFGDYIKVIKPLKLRQMIKKRAEKILENNN
jgi:predicted DNA-binding transcriptional regulator YafY